MRNHKKILYLGGSITCGAFASQYENSWAYRSFSNIAPVLFGEGTQMVNASISGTGSRVAAYRLADHVLPHQPDLVFIEFAVNDNSTSKTDPDMLVANMEYIVRTLKAHNPHVAITFVYTTNSSGENASHAHSIVAKQYDIPEIDLRAPLIAKIESGENEWSDFLHDTAHPTDQGHAFYADIVTRAVLADPARFTAPVKDAEPIAPFTYRHPRILPPSDAVCMDGFTIQEVFENTPFKHQPELLIRKGAVADCVGASLTVEFEGTNFGVYHRIGNFEGNLSVTIDSRPCGNVQCYYNLGNGTDPGGQFISLYYIRSLSNGKHTATLTVTDPPPASKGTAVCVTGFFVD